MVTQKVVGVYIKVKNIKKIKKRSITHGKTDTKLYNVWYTMRKRCSLKTVKAYKNYGSRGIKVCDDWENNFASFYNWAISNGYKEGLSIDRIDVDGNYEPNNCRWITKAEQNYNKRNNRVIKFRGEEKTISQWAKDLGINQSTLWMRLSKYGWSIEKSLSKK